MIGLTKQEWRVLGIVAALLLTGWATQKYRAAHPPVAAAPGAGTAQTAAMVPSAKP